jgi:hypothetical protein
MNNPVPAIPFYCPLVIERIETSPAIRPGVFTCSLSGTMARAGLRRRVDDIQTACAEILDDAMVAESLADHGERFIHSDI